MKPERRIAADIVLSDDGKMVFELLKKAEKTPLSDLKAQSRLSNKKWDKTIKELTKNNLAKVTKTDDALVVELVE